MGHDRFSDRADASIRDDISRKSSATKGAHRASILTGTCTGTRERGQRIVDRNTQSVEITGPQSGRWNPNGLAGVKTRTGVANAFISKKEKCFVLSVVEP